MTHSKRTYTLDEVERHTGFDKRTIAYYVQEDVLPKVGRRGPRTRYPELFLDRLLFIKRVRELQDAGRIGSMTLGEFKDVFDQLSAREISDLAHGRKPIEPIAHGAYEPRLSAPPAMASARRRAKLISEPHEESLSRRVESSSERWSSLGVARYADPVVDSPEPRPSRLGELLARLERSIGSRGTRADSRSERWTSANVTDNITVSVRELDEDAVDRLEELVKILRSAMPEDDDT